MKSTLKNTKIFTTTRPVFFGKTGLKTGFTLVELIVVISILAILGTIAFLSFGGYASKSRDSSRVSDIANLSKGLGMYSSVSGKYPHPEGIISTGTINGAFVTYKGIIQDQISSLAKMSKTPIDPLSNDFFIYGTTSDYKQYQIATTLENTFSLNNNLNIQTTYAASPLYSAKVSGNYKGIVKYYTGNTNWVANIPSLIYNFSGATTYDLITNQDKIYFVINKNTNLPYIIKSDSIINTKTGGTIIKEITNNSNATLTGISLSGVTNKTFSNTFTGITLFSFNMNGGDSNNVNVLQDAVKSLVFETSTSTSMNNNMTDTQAPTGGDFTMPANINSTTVSLTVTCPTDTSIPIQMYIDGTGLSAGGKIWETCTTTKTITITTGDGTKDITMKWRDGNLNETGVITRSISLSTFSTLIQTYTYIGNASQSFTIPAGVNKIKVKAWGAGGGAGGWSGDQGQGGAGGYVDSIIDVTPGEILLIYVGQKGGQAWCTASGPNAGWGFAMGGTGRQDHGGAGAGSTEIHRGVTRLIVAGGGGGAGSNYKSGAGCSGIQKIDGSKNGRNANDTGYSSHHAGAGGGGLVGGERMSTSVHNGAYGGSCLGDYVCGNGLTMTPCNNSESDGYGKGGYNNQNYACSSSNYRATDGYVKIFK